MTLTMRFRAGLARRLRLHVCARARLWRGIDERNAQSARCHMRSDDSAAVADYDDDDCVRRR